MKTKLTLLGLLLISLIPLAFGQNSRIWTTYFGGLGNDGGFSTATDPMGNIYLAGITMSANGIADSNSFQPAFGGGVVDAYLVKFDSSGNKLWSTYYGGPGDEMAFFGGKLGIATDEDGNVFLSGFTTSATGIAFNGFQNSPGGSSANAYLVKFDPAGMRLWATYYGGTSADKAYDVATDKLGNVYIAGLANSSGLASGGFQNTLSGSSDAFLAKFGPGGNRIWCTYYGGPSVDEGFAVATDDSFNVYLAGHTSSSSGISSGGFQNTFGGGNTDVFLVKFDSSGARKWATYYGGTGEEMFLFAGDIDVATDHQGNVYLTGLTSSTANIASGGYQNAFGGGASDAFLVRFNNAGNRIWGTYYGGTELDKGYNVTTNIYGNVYLTGRTESQNGIAIGGFDPTFSGGLDLFLVKFEPDGTPTCATYFGAADVDEANGVAVDASDHVYSGGNTASVAGIAWNGYQNLFGGGQSDAYLSKFTSCLSITGIASSDDPETLIFPNPSDGHFWIPTINDRTIVKIQDALGNEVYSTEAHGSLEINISNVRPGIYFLQLTTPLHTSTQKMILH